VQGMICRDQLPALAAMTALGQRHDHPSWLAINYANHAASLRPLSITLSHTRATVRCSGLRTIGNRSARHVTTVRPRHKTAALAVRMWRGASII
jgi:hypothetical protein